MRYKSFRIQNFKGIKDTSINFIGAGGAAVFAFVGLNESGKTTVLEAIHSFRPDKATSELLGGEEGTGVPFKERVPRHLISTFTGAVSVSATMIPTEADLELIASGVREELDLDLLRDDISKEITLARQQHFENGDFKRNSFSAVTLPRVKERKRRTWRTPSMEEHIKIRNLLYELCPDIAYFPTFVFEFPETIFLTDRGSEVDRFYRTVFQDILDYDGQGHNIERDIINRVRGKGMVVPWTAFLSLWGQHDDRPKIQHVMDRAGAAVTKLVFGQWNQIFREDVRGKEVSISYDTAEGEKQDAAGTKTKTQEHDVFIKFQIRDGTRRFNVNDRSLGFRWFFAFMLFTQFRVARSSARPLFFLFDEPASTLHAAAQQKLIDCFPGIAQGQHMLAYSTHSHYMVEPKWLEQTFIVTNRADAPSGSILDNLSLDDEYLDIKVTSYRSFVNEHPSQTSYFQPILDRLEVIPSRFDHQKSSVVLEGRSDYYVLRYAARATGREDDLPLLPGLGAGTFGALAALSVGWNLAFFFLLDGDKQGNLERQRYTLDYGIPPERMATLNELVDGVNTIEDLVDNHAREIIRDELGLSDLPSKGQIKQFFQERLASDQIKPLSDEFLRRASSLLDALRSRLNEQENGV
jgi:ABC-type phosphonate transport system ATPase subunit